MTRRVRQARTSPEIEAARITADATRKTAVLGAVTAVVVAVVTGLTGMVTSPTASPPPTPHLAPTHSSRVPAPSGGATLRVEDLDALQRARTLLERPAIQRLLSRCLDVESAKGIDSAEGRRCKDARLDLMASQRSLVDAVVDDLRGKGIVIQGV